MTMERKGDEIWKDHYLSTNYLVSDKGRIKRKKIEGKILIKKGIKNSGGYLSVSIRINGRSKTVTIHRSVAMAFIPNPENKPQINHIDGNKLNNDATNLEWCTGHENMRHAHAHKLMNIQKGELHHSAKIKREDVINIRSSDLDRSTLAIMYGVAPSTISNIKTRQKWKHI